ncbi:MAG: TetR/AcrR family transcriptional regulator [Candidatus Kapabacteria bacterium]|nr:TetR/AcrR family transcriptional regulator [Ignavibacteriota bacterium]MCW5883350.1 TetR/AcrR family transcriptional regulator [Candidatus Kapabacteria bacterium]
MNLREETKKRILKVAEAAFLQNGYKNLRIDDIAAELSISKRTFYELFRSKHELVYEIIDSALNNFRLKIQEVIGRMTDGDNFRFIDELKNLWQIIIEHTSYFSGEVINDLKLHLPGYWEKCERFDAERVDDFRRVYQAGIKQGYIKPNISEEVFYIIHFHALRNLLKPEILTNIPLSVNDILSNFYEILLTGALTQQARDEYISKLRN